MNCLYCSGFALCSAGLILTDIHYAGLVSGVWYAVCLLFWGGAAILSSRTAGGKVKRRAAILLAGLLLAAVCVRTLPEYSPGTAVRTVLAEHGELAGVPVRKAWDYSGFTDKRTYLLLFETDPLTAFLFDAYTGNYTQFDIAKELPFLH